MKISVYWNFEDTEFENFQYEEARKAAGLPKKINIKKLDEDEDIESYVYENYGFEIDSWESEDD